MRDGLVEGVHHGSVVVLAPDGSVVFRAGDVDTAFFPRSAAKPHAGRRRWPGSACRCRRTCSRSRPPATPARRSTSTGRSASSTAAGAPRTTWATRPTARSTRSRPPAWIAAGRPARRLAHNCSGKHAAMLATARLRGWAIARLPRPRPPAAARHRRHRRGPHRRADRAHGRRRLRVPRCSPSRCTALTRAVGRIAAAARGTAEGRVAGAMRTHPEMVAGSRRDVTALMRAVPGLIAKDGFEAVQVAALPDGTAIGSQDRRRLGPGPPAGHRRRTGAGRRRPRPAGPVRRRRTAPTASPSSATCTTPVHHDRYGTMCTDHPHRTRPAGRQGRPGRRLLGRAHRTGPGELPDHRHADLGLPAPRRGPRRGEGGRRAGQRRARPAPAADRRRDRHRLHGDPPRGAARPVRRRRHPGRRRDVDEHERQRGDRQPRAGAARARQGRLRARAPERARQPQPVHQRRLPHGGQHRHDHRRTRARRGDERGWSRPSPPRPTSSATCSRWAAPSSRTPSP